MPLAGRESWTPGEKVYAIVFSILQPVWIRSEEKVVVVGLQRLIVRRAGAFASRQGVTHVQGYFAVQSNKL
jgi:hypothetical protein